MNPIYDADGYPDVTSDREPDLPDSEATATHNPKEP